MKHLKNVLLGGSAVALFLFVLFVINQTAQVVDLASRVTPVLGTILLFVLLAIYAAAILVPLVLFLRLPAPLRPPRTEDSPDFPRHLEALRKRLSANRLVSGHPLNGREEIEGALAFLDAEADKIMRAAASKVFITTGVSQSGRLDALLVLSALSHMVWEIAHLYYQRPTPRDLLYLYGNVGATVFLAGELQDVEVHEHIEPLLAAAFGSAVSTFPGTALAYAPRGTGA